LGPPVEKEFDQQEDILCGRSIKNLTVMDLIESVPAPTLEEITSEKTGCQRDKLLRNFRNIPLGVVPVLGMARTGKTTFISRRMTSNTHLPHLLTSDLVALLFIYAEQNLIMVSPTNMAATKFVTRPKECEKHHKVLIRVWSKIPTNRMKVHSENAASCSP
jgi:hypothetical protein